MTLRSPFICYFKTRTQAENDRVESRASDDSPPPLKAISHVSHIKAPTTVLPLAAPTFSFTTFRTAALPSMAGRLYLSASLAHQPAPTTAQLPPRQPQFVAT